eukprot:NODE_249_length_11770_cov_0.803530.p2 type:complete len:950 gc:universal NODE_249_length_11770_cov_0.803530:9857-7008(-)
MSFANILQESQLSLIDADVMADIPNDQHQNIKTYHHIRQNLKLKEEEKRWKAILKALNLVDLFNYIFFGPGIILFIILDVCVDLPFLLLYVVEMETSPIAANILPIGLYVLRPLWVYDLCIILSFFNLFSFFSRCISALDTPKEILSWQTLVDALTCMPFIISLGIPNGNYLFVPYFLRSLIVIKRIRRLMFIQLELKKNSKFSVATVPTTGLSERLVTLVCAILVILYVGLCSFEYAEAVTSATQHRWRFFPSLYLMIVTGATVGYGDITPESNAGRFIIILFILVTIAVLPQLIGRVVETIRRQRQGGGTFEDKESRFIVIFGSFRNFGKIVDIIDFFQSDPELENVKIVMVGPEKVSDDISALISLPSFVHRIYYLKGSALNEQDLLRAKVQFADAAFILCDRDEMSGEMEDEHNCLRIWSFKRFAPNTKLFSISRTPQSLHFQRKADVVICTAIVKTVLLAFSSLNPGASTFVTNLMNSFNPHAKVSRKWIMEYNDGCCNEMFTCGIADHLKGFLFCNLAPFIYEHFQVILIGIRIWSPKHQKFYIFLNPYDYRPKVEDEFIIIAQNLHDVEEVENMDFEFFCNHYKEPSMVLGKDDSFKESILFEFPVINDSYTHAVPLKPSVASKRAICHLLKEPLPMEQRILDNALELKNHILIIPRNHDLGICMVVLRSAILQKSEIFDVVIFSPRLPTEEEYLYLQSFPRMFFVVGNPRKMKDLERAGALTCSRVIIFSQTEKSEHYVRDFDDAPSLMIKHSITILWQERCVKEKPVLVELHERRNVRHLSSDSLKQANVLKHSRLRKGKKEEVPYTSIEEVAYDPVFAAGGVMIDNMLDNIIFHSYKGSHAFDLVQTLCGIRLQEDLEIGREMGISNGYMFLEEIPAEFWGVSFAEFLRSSLTMFRRIPVAIYRPPTTDRGNQLPYIYTAPLPVVKLRMGDQAFFIGNR